MPRHEPDATTITAALELLTEHGFEGLASALELLLNEAMKLERSKFLGADPYERSSARRGYANGFKSKRIKSRLGEVSLSIPKVRGVGPGSEPFYPQAFERGERSERALKLALAEMYLQGVSTRKVAAITQELCGFDVSSTQVSRVTAELDGELNAWRNRPLGRVPYLILDARYEKVRHGGQVIDCAVLMAVGVRSDGKRSVLGCSVSLSEAEVHWRAFLESLVARGMHGVRLVTSDDHSGLKAALRSVLAPTPWQRCQFHLQQNASSYVPQVEQRSRVAADIRAIFNAPDRVEADRMLERVAERWSEPAPKLAEWMLRSIPEGLTVMTEDPKVRRRLRTSNVLERLSKEVKRRTRVATLFPNEASLLRLVTAILSEVWRGVGDRTRLPPRGRLIALAPPRARARNYRHIVALSDGSLFVFFNRRRDRIKLLAWDGNGFWLFYKRLETGTFESLRASGAKRISLSRAELSMLLDGIALGKGKKRANFTDVVRIDGRASGRKEASGRGTAG